MHIRKNPPRRRSLLSFRAVEYGIFILNLLLVIGFRHTLWLDLSRSSPSLPNIKSGRPIVGSHPFVSVDSEQIVRVSTGREFSVPIGAQNELSTFSSIMAAWDPDTSIELRLDNRVPMSTVHAILHTIRNAGVRQVTFVGVPNGVPQLRQGQNHAPNKTLQRTLATGTLLAKEASKSPVSDEDGGTARPAERGR